MSFTFAARNVAESKRNLTYCSTLIKKTYLNYKERGTRTVGTIAAIVPNLHGVNPDLLSVNFGNLIQDTDVYLTKVNFNVDFEAGFYTFNNVQVGLLNVGTDGQLQDIQRALSNLLPHTAIPANPPERWQLRGEG